HLLAVWAEKDHCEGGISRSLEGTDLPATGHIPQHRRLVVGVGAGKHLLAVWAEYDCTDSTHAPLTPRESAWLLAADRVPQYHSLVEVGEHMLAVRTERRRADLAGMPLEGSEPLPGGCLPQDGRLEPASEYLLTVRAE